MRRTQKKEEARLEEGYSWCDWTSMKTKPGSPAGEAQRVTFMSLHGRSLA